MTYLEHFYPNRDLQGSEHQTHTHEYAKSAFGNMPNKREKMSPANGRKHQRETDKASWGESFKVLALRRW